MCSSDLGCLPTLLPGGRPVEDPRARVDVAAAWGVEHLPEAEGRSGDAILEALSSGELGGLVIAGVDPLDTSNPTAALAAIDAAGFVVALDLRRTEVTDRADVVFPVAPTTDKAGTFVNWEGRVRTWEAALHNPASLPDLRALAGIADEMGAPLGFRTVDEVRAEMAQLGPWDGERPRLDASTLVPDEGDPTGSGTVRLATWKQLLDNGSLQDGDKFLKATARTPVALVTPADFDRYGPTVTLTGDRGSMTLPAEICDDLVEGVVWVPANSVGNGVLADLASPGATVTITGAEGVHG